MDSYAIPAHPDFEPAKLYAEVTDAASGEIVHASPYYQVTEPHTIRFLLPGRSDAVLVHTGSEFHLGQSPPHWFGQFANSATSVRIEPALTQNAALFLYQEADRSPHDALPYRLYHSGSVVASGLLPGTGAFWDRVNPAQIPLSASGAYSLEVTYDQYWIGADPGQARMLAEFDTSLTDKNPPTLLALNVLHNGEMASLLPPGAPAEVRFRVTDSSPLSQVSLFYRDNGDWVALTLTKEGNDYTAHLPGFPEGTRVSLRIIARDTAGNSLTYEAGPALSVQVPPHTPTPTNTPTPTASPVPSPTPAQTTVTLQQGSNGYEGCEDTYIDQGAPDSNYCDADQVYVGVRQESALLRFDLSTLPAGATVNQASLQLFANSWWTSADMYIDAFRILRRTDPCQATWNVSQTGEPWATPGCNDPATDRAGDAESSLKTWGASRWYTFDLTTLVQDWLDGTLDNNGVLLRLGSPADSTRYAFASAEHSDVALRPKLVITYSVPQCVPTLISPEPGAVMDNGRTDGQDERVWDFDWSDCAGADAYHLYVMGSGATIPLVNNVTTESSYQDRSRGYIVHRFNWLWRVRARVDGIWGPWSEERYFDVEPANTDPPQLPTPTHTHTPTPIHTGTPTPTRTNTLTPSVTPTTTPTARDPLIRVTADIGNDNTPSIAQSVDGTLWVAWQSDRSGNKDIWYKTSDDIGATWSSARQFTSDPGADIDPALTVLSDGTLWMVWASDRSGNNDLWYKTSGDGGATWSTAAQVTTDSSSDSQPSITQTSDGTVWVVWASDRSGSSDVWYKTSNDNGLTWSTEGHLPTDTGSNSHPAITETSQGVLWITWASGHDVWAMTSSDGGSSWSAKRNLEVNWVYCQAYQPMIVEGGDGTLWLTWSWLWFGIGQKYRTGSDVMFKTSSDGGETWSYDAHWSSFMGYNDNPALAVLSDGSVAVVFDSNRWANEDIWFGIFGRHDDVRPPPYVDLVYDDAGSEVYNDETVTVSAYVDDETGIESVSLVWTRNGTPQGSLEMHKEMDWMWYVEFGPFPAGAQIAYQVRVIDMDGNAVTAPLVPNSFIVVQRPTPTPYPVRAEDTYIYRWAPDSNYCGENQLKVGYKQQYAALLQFDLSQIPANATVTYARLELWATGWDGTNMDIKVYRILRDANLCQATWNQAQAGNPWGIAGCNDTLTDRAAEPEVCERTSGVNTQLAFGLTELVQDWVSGTLANNGILLRGASELSASLFGFGSAEHSDENVRPRLVVYYEVEGEPTATPTQMPTATHTPSATPTSTPTVTPTSIPGPPTLIVPEDGTVLPQPVEPGEWLFTWDACGGPCLCYLVIEGPGGRYISEDSIPPPVTGFYQYHYTQDTYLPDDALGPWYWHVSVCRYAQCSASERRSFSVRPAHFVYLPIIVQ